MSSSPFPPSIECPSCGLVAASPECPSCGHRLRLASGTPMGSATALARGYLTDVTEIILRPTRFFRTMPLRGGLGGPLAFALVTHWLGAAISFVWFALIGTMIGSGLGGAGGLTRGLFKVAGDMIEIDHPGKSAQLYEAQERIINWMWGAGSVIADPFLTLISILFTSAFVFIGARLLIAPGLAARPREITFESTARIICYSTAPALLAGLPIVGGLVASILVGLAAIIGIREAYRVGYGRAILVALFPKILFFGILLMGMLLFAAALLKMISMAL